MAVRRRGVDGRRATEDELHAAAVVCRVSCARYCSSLHRLARPGFSGDDTLGADVEAQVNEVVDAASEVVGRTDRESARHGGDVGTGVEYCAAGRVWNGGDH